MSEQRVYLEHIRDSITLISEFTNDESRQFFEDQKTQQAVLRTLQTLAESTKHIPDSIKARFPEVDWSGIIGFRNILVHAYLGVDTEMAWQIVEDYLPQLDQAVRTLLVELDRE